MPKNARPQQDYRTSFYQEIQRNKLKSWALAVFVFAGLVALVYVFALVWDPASATVITLFSLVFVALYTLGTYYWGDSVVLAATSAKPLPDTPPYQPLRDVVENLAFGNRLPTPKLYLIESEEMNAFATGRDPEHASVAVTTALYKRLNRTELEGVIAHELSHVSNYDIRFSMIVGVMVGLVAILSNIFLRSLWFGGGRGSNRDEEGGGLGLLIIIGIILAIVAPFVVRLVQLAVSRKRELLADASGAKLTRYPEGLASALEKIGGVNKGDMKVSEAVSHLFFVDPVRSPLDALFATHPPIEERIKLLRAM